MNTTDGFDDPKWPPGTVRLTELLGDSASKTDIVLQPRPTENPNDPLNWPKWQKAINFTLASYYAMLVYGFISATSATWGPLSDELGFSNATLTNSYAIGCATLAIGAPTLIPFALKFGSRPVYIISSAAQMGIAVWAARTQNAGDWWAVNALQCWLGALCEVLIQMTIADVFFVHQRGLMNSIYVWMLNVGSNLAVVAAGFIASDMGWRWVWWWFTIFLGLQLVLFTFGFEETKFTHVQTADGRQGSVVADTPPDVSGHIHGDYKTVDEKTANTSPTAAVDPEVGSSGERKLSVVHINPNIPRKTYWQKLTLATTSPGSWSSFFRHAWQPFLILGTIPGVLFCALVYAIVLATQGVQISVLSTVMLEPPYNFNASQIGLMSLAPFIGNTLGSIISGPLSDYVAVYLAKRNNGIYEPEFRFWVFIPFIPFELAGCWWFGYALQNGDSWVQVAIAYGFSYFAFGPIQSIALTYLIDAYNEIIGDALTAVTIIRNVFSTIFVFAIPAWLAGVGIGNVFNTVNAIAIVILGSSALFIWRGKQFRVKTVGVYKYFADRQFEGRLG